MLARVPQPETPEAKAERLRNSLRLPDKTNLLKLAEQTVDRVRTKRAELKDEIQAAVISGGSANKALVQQLTADLEAFERDTAKKAFDERTRRREEFGTSAMAKLGPVVGEFRDEINRMLDEMEALNAAAVELLAASNANGFEALSGIKASLPLASHIRAARQIINSNGSMFR